MKNPLHMFAAAKQSDVLTLYVYDSIGGDFFGEGITAKAVADKLDSAGNISSIQMRINSPGGNPFEAVAIANLIRGKGKPVDVIVDGLAASAASVLAMAGDTVSMGEGSMLMIHNASAVAFGNAAELRQLADTLDKVSGTLADTYAARTKLPVAEIQALMNAETWFTAQEAVAKGFADSIVQADAKARAVAASFDLRGFRNTPVALRKDEAQYTQEELLRLRLNLA